jgi:hypothetical protein
MEKKEKDFLLGFFGERKFFFKLNENFFEGKKISLSF